MAPKRYTPSIAELLEHRERARTPEAVARIDSYIEVRRMHNKRRNAVLAQSRAERSPEEVARILADHFPDGRQVCRTCGRTLPLSAFDPFPTAKVPLWHHCRGCQAEQAEANDHA